MKKIFYIAIYFFSTALILAGTYNKCAILQSDGTERPLLSGAEKTIETTNFVIHYTESGKAKSIWERAAPCS